LYKIIEDPTVILCKSLKTLIAHPSVAIQLKKQRDENMGHRQYPPPEMQRPGNGAEHTWSLPVSPQIPEYKSSKCSWCFPQWIIYTRFIEGGA
jgi:hypothetical protein